MQMTWKEAREIARIWCGQRGLAAPSKLDYWRRGDDTRVEFAISIILTITPDGRVSEARSSSIGDI